MTCEEIIAQISELTDGFDALTASIESRQSGADIAFLACLAADTLGGTYPTSPETTANVGARIAYLYSLSPQPTALISQYSALQQTLYQIAGSEIALQQTVTLLGQMKQQATDQGCYQS
jgi:hypothetical protein